MLEKFFKNLGQNKLHQASLNHSYVLYKIILICMTCMKYCILYQNHKNVGTDNLQFNQYKHCNTTPRYIIQTLTTSNNESFHNDLYNNQWNRFQNLGCRNYSCNRQTQSKMHLSISKFVFLLNAWFGETILQMLKKKTLLRMDRRVYFKTESYQTILRPVYWSLNLLANKLTLIHTCPEMTLYMNMSLLDRV